MENLIQSFGLDVQRHPFVVKKDLLNQKKKCAGTNMYATIPAPKGSGKESIVISASMNHSKADNLGLALALIQYFTCKPRTYY